MRAVPSAQRVVVSSPSTSTIRPQSSLVRDSMLAAGKRPAVEPTAGKRPAVGSRGVPGLDELACRFDVGVQGTIAQIGIQAGGGSFE